MNGHIDNVAEAFSRKAGVYDGFGEEHVNLSRMRQKVYDHITRLVQPGSLMLEINAGTGLDAREMVRRGFRVHATDLSPGMTAEIERKIKTDGLSGRLTVQRCSFTALDQVTTGPFDAVYSNFGGLNCIDDLTAVTSQLPYLLKPGGIVTFVIMPRICPWELARAWKDWRVAVRRLRPSGVLANVEGISFKTTYYPAPQVERAFDFKFRRIKREGLSVITPPADNKRFAVNHPRLYRWLVKGDDWLSHRRPFNGWGDFCIVSMLFKG